MYQTAKDETDGGPTFLLLPGPAGGPKGGEGRGWLLVQLGDLARR
jgi:hypothetical protein